MTREARRFCVFCGSNSGHRNVFSDAALELGNELQYTPPMNMLHLTKAGRWDNSAIIQAKKMRGVIVN